MPPYQGYRLDFWHEHSEHSTNQIFMIYPDLEDKDGRIITDSEVCVPEKGVARMWILAPQMRNYHRDKIKIGLVCYFMEKPRRVAECEVIEIIDLLINQQLPIEVNGKWYE